MADQWERVYVRTKRMWWKVGTLLEAKAYEDAVNGMDQSAVRFAAAAEACFAQSTGDGDAVNVSTLIGGKL